MVSLALVPCQQNKGIATCRFRNKGSFRSINEFALAWDLVIDYHK